MRTKQQILARLKELAQKESFIDGSGNERWYYPDPETYHVEADRLLLELINDQEISEAFDAIEKWYA